MRIRPSDIDQAALPVLSRIIRELPAATSPPEQLWTSYPKAEDPAVSAITGEAYANSEAIMLRARQGFHTTNRWLTALQVADIGETIRQGERPYGLGTPAATKRYNENITPEEASALDVHLFVGVYNSDQLVGREPPKGPARLRAADAFLRATGIKVFHEGNRCIYTPTHDEIILPQVSRFKSTGGFYSALFHELMHATGHSARGDRISLEMVDHGPVSAREEILCELGSAFLCAAHRIKPVDHTAGYIKGMLPWLKQPETVLVEIADEARKAAGTLCRKAPIPAFFAGVWRRG